jgi:hypothetical protein
MGDTNPDCDGDDMQMASDDGPKVGTVEVYWRGGAAEAQGQSTTFGGIEWVCEHQDRIILVPRDGTPQEPPRTVIYRKDICAFHERERGY